MSKMLSKIYHQKIQPLTGIWQDVQHSLNLEHEKLYNLWYEGTSELPDKHHRAADHKVRPKSFLKRSANKKQMI